MLKAKKLMADEKCPDCGGKGRIFTKEGVRTCFKCLVEGRLDNHSKILPDHNIKL